MTGPRAYLGRELDLDRHRGRGPATKRTAVAVAGVVAAVGVGFGFGGLRSGERAKPNAPTLAKIVQPDDDAITMRALRRDRIQGTGGGRGR
jgi:hypothetical protein